MNTQFVELPKVKAKAFKALCAESGVAAQVWHGEKTNRVYPACVPADFEALKIMFGETNGTPIL